MAAAEGYLHTYSVSKAGSYWFGSHEIPHHPRRRPLGRHTGRAFPMTRRRAMANAEAYEAQILSRRGVDA